MAKQLPFFGTTLWKMTILGISMRMNEMKNEGKTPLYPKSAIIQQAMFTPLK